MSGLYCQSCGLPMQNDNVIGTYKDGSKNRDYCVYCYNDGVFLQDVNMDEMININLKHMKETFKDDPSFNEQKVQNSMDLFFPQLKRWAK